MTDSIPAVSTSPPVSQYACYKCRRILFTSAALMAHTAGQVNAATFAGKKASNSALSHSVCSSHFVDPDTFAIGAFTDNEGKLSCPHCRAKLGSFTWSGEQCSCGRWVTPAFMFSKSKVDEKRPAGQQAVDRSGLRAPVVVFRPQLDAEGTTSGSSGSGEKGGAVGGLEERKEADEVESKQSASDAAMQSQAT